MAGGKPSIYDLATRFKVRRESIYRDLKALQEIGYALVGDAEGRLSRPRLAPGVWPTVPGIPLTRREVAAVVWAAKQAPATQPFHTALSMSTAAHREPLRVAP